MLSNAAWLLWSPYIACYAEQHFYAEQNKILCWQSGCMRNAPCAGSSQQRFEWPTAEEFILGFRVCGMLSRNRCTGLGARHVHCGNLCACIRSPCGANSCPSIHMYEPCVCLYVCVCAKRFTLRPEEYLLDILCVCVAQFDTSVCVECLFYFNKVDFVHERAYADECSGL